MKTSTQRMALPFELPALRPTRDRARVTPLRSRHAATDGTQVAPPTLGAEAWPWHLVPRIRATDSDPTRAASPASPLSDELYEDAQRRRTAFLGATIAAALRAIGAVMTGALTRFRQLRAAHETYVALRRLDDRSLHDLGFARDEIRSVAAEMAGQAEHSRLLARPTYPVRPSLFELLFR